MADNVTIPPTGSGTATPVVATDDVSGVHFQKVKIDVGGDGATAMLSNSNPVPVSDAGGSLTIDGAVTNAGTFAVQESGGALTALQLLDDAVFAEDVAAQAADKGVAVLAVRRDADTSLVGTDNDYANLQVNATGALKVEVFDGGDSHTIDGSVSVTGTVTVDGSGVTQPVSHAALTELAAAIDTEVQCDIVAALPAGTNNIGDVDILSIAAGDNNIGNVDVVTLPNVTLAAGTNTNEVVGDAAHDAAIAGNPLRIAGRALTSDYTAVAAGDTADLITTLLGKLVVMPYANPAKTWSYAAASGGITNTSGVTAKAAGGSGVRNYITRVQVINGHATVSTDVQIRDGAAGTVLWRGFAAAAGGGAVVQFDPPLRGTADTLVEVACGTTGTATYFNLQGYEAQE